MNIYLIGMPGCGKSTLGKKLADSLKMEFIDLDNYIEQQALMFIDEIFEAFDEPYFRALETNALKEVDEKDNCIIATGGGIIKNPQNKEAMHGKIIYLYVDVDALEDRIKESGTVRPLLEDNTLGKLFLERKDSYTAFADVTIDNSDINQAIKQIMSWLDK